MELEMNLAGVDISQYPALDPKLAGHADKAVRLQQFFAWARERHAVYLRRNLVGQPRPWTNDPFLQSYRWCNVHREIDAVSLWIRKNIIDVFEEHEMLWFMLMLTRYINFPGSLDALIKGPREAWPDGRKWDWRVAADVLNSRRASGEQMVTGAYIVNSVAGEDVPEDARGNKARVIMYRMSKAWECRNELKTHFKTSMQEAVETYQSVVGFGPFLAYQAAVDLSYSAKWLKNAPDVNEFNSAGPGTTRGICRLILGEKRGDFSRLDTESKTRAICFLVEAAKQEKYWPQTSCQDPESGWASLSMANLSNCLCEFDKYNRLALGEGEPRSRYAGTANSRDNQRTLF